MHISANTFFIWNSRMKCSTVILLNGVFVCLCRLGSDPVTFIAHLIAWRPSYACLSVCLSVCLFVRLSVCLSVNFWHFHLLFQNHWATNFNQSWHKATFGEDDSSFFSNEGPRPFPRGDNYEIAKIHWQNLKIFFSRTTWPISTNHRTKRPWVKKIQD